MKLGRIQKKYVAVIVLVTALISSFITYSFAGSISNTLTLSAGVYPGAPSYTMWTDGTNYFAKDQNGIVDYSGIVYETVAQSAYTTLSSTGGTVYWESGNYTGLTTSINVPAEVVTVGMSQADDVGSNLGTCLVRSADVPIFTLDAVRHVTFRNMLLRGAGKTDGKTSALIDLDNTCGDTVIESVTFAYSGGSGVEWGGDSYWLTMRNCQGVYLAGSLITKTDYNGGTTLKMDNCIAHYSGHIATLTGIRGVDIHCGGGDNIDGYGYKFELCSGVMQSTDVEALTNGHTVWIVQGCINLIGNRFWGCGNSTTYLPIYISGQMNGKIEGNFLEDTVSDYDVGLASDIAYTTIESNQFSSVNGISGYNINDTVTAKYNEGYQTCASVSGTIYHGEYLNFSVPLAGTPNIITLGVADDTGDIIVSYDPNYVDALQVRIMLYNVTAGAVVWTPNTCLVSCYAEYRP